MRVRNQGCRVHRSVSCTCTCYSGDGRVALLLGSSVQHAECTGPAQATLAPWHLDECRLPVYDTAGAATLPAAAPFLSAQPSICA